MTQLTRSWMERELARLEELNSAHLDRSKSPAEQSREYRRWLKRVEPRREEERCIRGRELQQWLDKRRRGV